MQSYNIIEGLEAQEYSWKKQNPESMAGTPTTESETLSFSGSLVAMKALAEKFLQEGNMELLVSCNITRDVANMAQLQVTRAWYHAPALGGDDEEESGGGGESSPSQGVPGSSESNPVISFDFTEVQVPILTHPLVTKQQYQEDGKEMIALRMHAKGADRWQTFTAQANEVVTVGEVLEGLPSEVVNLVGSQEFYLDVVVTCTYRWEVTGDKLPDFGTFPRIESPPKAPKLSGERNWLFCGGGLSMEGGRIMASKTYKSSDVKGWNKDCYPD